MRPKDMTDQEVTSFDDGEVLQHVRNVDQMVRDVEFQGVYTAFELVRLKQLIEDSKKPLYLGSHKYSRLSGDLKLLVRTTKVSNNYWIYLETCYLRETK
jgi:hypothetical protein